MGSTPWGWLVGAAGLLLALSLAASALFHEDNRGEAYVPAEAFSDGHVAKGEFKKVEPAR